MNNWHQIWTHTHFQQLANQTNLNANLNIAQVEREWAKDKVIANYILVLFFLMLSFVLFFRNPLQFSGSGKCYKKSLWNEPL